MIKAKAKVNLTFVAELDISSGWSEDCTVGQVKKQSMDDAKRVAEILEEYARSKNINLKYSHTDAVVHVFIGNEL